MIFAVGALGRAEDIQRVSVCQIKTNPAAYDHTLVQVTAFASHGFEDFTLLDPTCQGWPEIWLEYGGTIASGTEYCCNVSKQRKRSKPAAIEGTVIPLVDDKAFRDFDRLIQRPPDSIAHATLIGRFFAGGHSTAPNSGSGFGQRGCCSLLMIQQVLAVDAQDRTDLDYRSSPEQPSAFRLGCEIKALERATGNQQIAAQQQAEAGPRAWSFDDPVRVAAGSLTTLLKLDPGTAISMTQSKKSQGRLVYEWKPPGTKDTLTVVVNRPYWLSFSAKDPQKLAWVVMAVYQSSCQ